MADKGSDGNLMPIDIFKRLFPKAAVEQLAKHKDKRVTLHTYNKSKMQLGVFSVTLKHKKKDKLCRFLVLSQGGPALLHVPDIEIHGILRMKYTEIELRGHTSVI